jgi:hypothetical protein
MIVFSLITRPIKQPPYQPHKTQCLSLTPFSRYNAIVNESGYKRSHWSKTAYCITISV